MPLHLLHVTRFKARLASACGILPFLLGVAPAYAAPIELKETLRYALQHVPALLSAEENHAIRLRQKEQAAAKFLPSLDFKSTQGLQKAEPAVQGPTMQQSGSGPGFGQLTLSLTETLYDNGQSFTQRDIADANAKISELQIRQTRDDVIYQVTKAFYSLSQADILWRTDQQQAELMNKQLRLLDVKYRQGLKTKIELTRLQSQVQRAELEVMTAQNARTAAAIDLLRAMGAPVTDNAFEFATLNAEEALRDEPVLPTVVPVVADSYTARISRLEDIVAERNINLAERKNLPVITLSSAVEYQNPDYIAASDRPWVHDYFDWNVSLGLTYNIWDAGSRRNDIAIAASERSIKAQEKTDKLATLAADIHKLMASLPSLGESFRLNKRLIALEQENFDHLEKDYREGKVAYLDLVGGLQDLLTAKVGFFTTYIAILQAQAQYRYYKGTIYDGVADS